MYVSLCKVMYRSLIEYRYVVLLVFFVLNWFLMGNIYDIWYYDKNIRYIIVLYVKINFFFKF